MPLKKESSNRRKTMIFTLDSLTAALEQVQALHEISADLIAESVFGQPAQQGQGEPVALAIPDECPHIIVFDDADQSDEYFCGAGARPAALRRFEQISRSWNAHLFVRVARNSRDDRYPSATVADPAEVERLSRDLHAAKVALEARARTFDTLRADLETMRRKNNEYCETEMTLRAQLAEAQALLASAYSNMEQANNRLGQCISCGELPEGEDEDVITHIPNCTFCEIDAALSASAEPSAPVDPDQIALDCATEVMGLLEKLPLPGGRAQFKAAVQCRVIAALERKP